MTKERKILIIGFSIGIVLAVILWFTFSSNNTRVETVTNTVTKTETKTDTVLSFVQKPPTIITKTIIRHDSIYIKEPKDTNTFKQYIELRETIRLNGSSDIMKLDTILAKDTLHIENDCIKRELSFILKHQLDTVKTINNTILSNTTTTTNTKFYETDYFKIAVAFVAGYFTCKLINK